MTRSPYDAPPYDVNFSDWTPEQRAAMRENDSLCRAVLASRILNVIDSIGVLKKDGHNEGQDYDYHSHAALTAEIRSRLVNFGVMLYTSIDSQKITIIQGERWDKFRKPQPGPVPFTEILTEVSGTMTAVDVYTGYSETVSIQGQGIDPRDKGGAKAETMAVKYGLRRLAFVSDQESDPDYDGGKHPEPESDKTPADQARKGPPKQARKTATTPVKVSNGSTPTPPTKNAVTGAEGGKESTPAPNGTPGQVYSRAIIDPESLRKGLRLAAAKEPQAPPDSLLKITQVAAVNFVRDETKRHAMLWYLFDKGSTRDLTKGECAILLKWIGMQKNIPSAEAVEELRLILQRVDAEARAAA